MTLNSLTGRGDLAALVTGRSPEEAEPMAGLLGFGRKKDQPKVIGDGREDSPDLVADGVEVKGVPAPVPVEAGVAFYYARRFERLNAPEVTPTTIAAAMPAVPWVGQPAEAPAYPELRSPAQMQTLLRRILSPHGPAPEIDIARAVELAAQGQPLVRLPQRERRRWPEQVVVVCDRGRHLAPFWPDQERVIAAVQSVTQARISVLSRNGLFDDGDGAVFREAVSDGAMCLGLSDFGVLGGAVDAEAVWRNIGRAFGPGRAVALTPAPIDAVPARLRQVWRVEPWEAAPSIPLDSEARAAAAVRLLGLFAPALMIEPALVRAMRHALAPEADLAVEAVVWGHGWLDRAAASSARLTQAASKKLRAAFDGFTETERRRALAILRAWRGGRGEDGPGHDLWFAEVLNLSEASRALLPEPRDIAEAQAFFAAVAVQGQTADGLGLGSRAWLSRLGDRTETAWREDGFRAAVWTVKQGEASFVPPVSPSAVKGGAGEVTRVALAQMGDRLLCAAEATTVGSHLGLLPSKNGLFEIEQLDDRRPAWASEWGGDEIGHYVDFTISGATQRMRWIAPGSFMMGSPKVEEGRDSDEGPRHKVIIGEGFWLFETACTQTLWSAVMGRNPSRFKGGRRPVDGVSWNDAMAFIERINHLVPGLELSLPSEAQWEYACRAGTATPFSFGANISANEVNYDGNYPYGGGREGRFRQETVEVGSLPANAWGLHEMHGNLWEWCSDHWHDSYVGAPIDGRAWTDPDAALNARRVLRGGTWFTKARYVRSASRNRIMASEGDIDLGFRCARTQSGGVVPRGQRWANGGEVELTRERVSSLRPKQVDLPSVPFVIRTDRGAMALDLIRRSDWAVAMGRDRYGLWTEFEIEAKTSNKKPKVSVAPVSQRMRWIAPGAFMMGSVEGDAERYEAEGPRHEVAIGEGFWLFDTACTQALWSAIMGKNPSHFKGERRPVDNVSWDDAMAFIERINGLVPGLALGLPSEAQWEYACRTGTDTPFSLGSNISSEQVNYDGNYPYGGAPKGLYRAETVEVGSLPANGWGLYEMHGNLWEWCADHWHDSYAGAPADGLAWNEADASPTADRVLRGGSWDGSAQNVRSASRAWDAAYVRDFSTGFRCARGQE